jgi:hypothetical protein
MACSLLSQGKWRWQQLWDRSLARAAGQRAKTQQNPVVERQRTSKEQDRVLHRGMGTRPMGTILEFASVPLKKIGTDLLGSWWP